MTRLPSYPWRFAHLAALWAYGVAQPVFSMLKGNPEFLVVRGSTRTDVVAFVLLLAVVPPLLVVALEALASLASTTLAGVVHVAGIWGFGFLAALQIARLLEPDGGVALLLPVAAGWLAAVLYVRVRPVRTFLSISFVLPVVGSALFLIDVPLAVDDRAGADVAVASPVPVVLVVFDEFPVSSILTANGSIDAVRYPNFGRLARDATWYARATTVHDRTPHAVPAILTGRLPRRGSLPTLADHPDNIFTLLGERYDIRSSEQVTRLCPSRYCPRAKSPPLIDRSQGLMYDVSVAYLHRSLPTSLRRDLPAIGQRWGSFGDSEHQHAREQVLVARDEASWLRAWATAAEQKRAQFDGFLRSLATPCTRPTLFFEHALLPHGVWRYLPSGREYPNAEWVAGIDEDWDHWGPSAALVSRGLQRHLLQVGYTDRLLGELLARLDATGLYDRAIVVVTADHGASFRPNGLLRSVVPANLADIAAVPLIVKYPRQRAGRIDRRAARTIDIVPTIADVIGVRIPWRVDGRSLRAAPETARVSVARKAGPPVESTPDAVASDVLATARRNARLFGEGRDSLYRVGPYRSLLGQPVARLNVSSDARAGARLEHEQWYANVRRRSLLVPTRVVGEIVDSSLARGAAIAVAVNGRVAAVTTSFSFGDRHAFAAMVPETAFRDGPNRLDLYLVRGTSDEPRLGRLGGTPDARSPAPRLIERSGPADGDWPNG